MVPVPDLSRPGSCHFHGLKSLESPIKKSLVTLLERPCAETVKRDTWEGRGPVTAGRTRQRESETGRLRYS